MRYEKQPLANTPRRMQSSELQSTSSIITATFLSNQH